MQRRRVFPLLASAALAGATALRASPTGNPSQCSQFHVDWVTKVLERMQTIKPGSTRKALLTVFTTEGGGGQGPIWEINVSESPGTCNLKGSRASDGRTIAIDAHLTDVPRKLSNASGVERRDIKKTKITRTTKPKRKRRQPRRE